MKKIVSLVLAVLMVAGCVAAFTACNKDQDAKVIKIGLIAPLTGAVAVYGTSVEKGAKMAVEEINANSALLGGFTIELVEKDSVGDVNTAVAAMNALIDTGIHAIIGPVITGTTSAVASIANENEIVMITPSATGDKITTASDYVFRSCFKNSYQGVMAAQYAKKLGKTEVAVLYALDSDYSTGLYQAFRAECERLGITVKAAETSPTIKDEVSFDTQLQKIKEAVGEDGFLFAPYYYEAIGTLIVPQARAAGFRGIIMGADGYDGVQDYMKKDQLASYDNVYFTNHYSAESTNEKVVNFISGYKAKYNENPTAFSALAYDAVYMLAAALEKALNGGEDAGALTGAAIKAALDGSSIEGVTGNFRLDETGTPVKDVVVMKYQYNAATAAVELKYVETLKAN